MKTLILSRLNSHSGKANVGFWIMVDATDADSTVAQLGDKFIFRFDLDPTADAPLINEIEGIPVATPTPSTTPAGTPTATPTPSLTPSA